MAQRVHVVLVDDIDGSDAGETVTFGLDGSTYEIDLNEKNATALREALAPYVGHARRSGGPVAARRPRPQRAADRAPPRSASGPARTAGTFPDRGRVSADVRQAYDAAH